MDYILQRPSGYYFRLMVPSDLKESFGISEIRRSLKTGSVSLAKERANLLSGRIKKLFRTLRNNRQMKLEKHQIDDLIKSYMKETLEFEEDERLMAGPVVSKEHHDYIMKSFEDALIEYKDCLRVNSFNTVEPIVESQILIPNGIQADKDSFEYKKLCREFTKAQISFIHTQMKRETGEYPLVDFETIPEPPPADKRPAGPTIGHLKDKWFKENTKANLWKPRTHKQYAGHFSVMLQILDEKTPIESVDHSTVRHIKDCLLKLPPGMNKKKIFKDKSVQEIIEITEKEGLETLNVNTINGYIITLGAFFKWCVGNGYMTANYADGAKIKVNRKTRPDEIRKAFTLENLEQLFNAPGYTEDKFVDSYQFWLPVLGLYTGARINELCQLRLDDIQEINDIPCLVFQEDSQDKELSIKNTASMRTVPIHPFVADGLNFMGYVQTMKDRGEVRLFPELPYQNFNYGHKATKWFGQFRKKQGIDSKQLVFHSFRHTLSDNLKQQLITETLIDELTGHAIQGETMGRYGKRYSVEVLYSEAVLKLDYKVDLEHLKGSKWTTPGTGETLSVKD